MKALPVSVLMLIAIGAVSVSTTTARPADDGCYDLVVVGATPGGIASAVRAAREGLAALLVHHSPHIGGFITSGGGGWEAPYDGLRSPIYAELLTAASDYYRNKYGEGSQQHRASLPSPDSNKHTDRRKIEPHVAEMLFNRMVAGEPRLALLTGFYVAATERSGAKLVAVKLQSMDGDDTRRVAARIFVDATYEGDLAAAAKVPYRVGREGRDEFDEPHAGVVYTKNRHKEPGQQGFPMIAERGFLKIRTNGHSADEVLPESTGEADNSVMAYNFRLILTKVAANRVPIPKPDNTDPTGFRGILHRSIVPNLPNDKIAWNGGGRLVGPQDEYPEADWPSRARLAQKYLDAALRELWLVQNAPGVSAKERNFWKDYGLAKDEFVDNGHVPYEIYVREARRIVGRKIFTEHDGVLAPGIDRTPIHSDSIAMTDWPLDSVVCRDRSVPEGNSDGIFFLAVQSRPAQVPYRCLLPQGVDNLLVPVCLSATHVGWGCIRLEPVWMQTGEAAGLAAAMAIKTGRSPAELDSDRLVQELADRRSMVSFFNDVDVASKDSWVPAVQYFGTRGFFDSYDARPDQPLCERVAQLLAETYGRLAARQPYDATEAARALSKASGDGGPSVTLARFVTMLNDSACNSQPEHKRIEAAAAELGLAATAPSLTRAEACELMYQALDRK